jgi:MOSC domain-containing protein YiiM
MAGLLIGIAGREQSRAPMIEQQRGRITVEAGLQGDCKGSRFPLRQITILDIAAWNEACAILGVDLPWTTRRANLLTQAVSLPRGLGSRLKIGKAELEVTGKTSPCLQMDLAFQGLRRALADDWRGGVTCKVIQGGEIATGDQVSVLLHLPEKKVHLPG